MTRRHGPAVLAAIQGHLRRVDGDADLLEPGDHPGNWTTAALDRRCRLRLLSRADRALLWAAVLLALLALAGLAAPGACSEHPPPVTPVAETGERDMTRKTERTERTCGRDEQLVTLTEGEVNERATEMAKLLEEADRVESLMQEETRSTRLRIKALRAGAKEYQRDVATGTRVEAKQLERDAVARAASTAAIDVKVKRRRAKRSAETEV